MFVCGAIVLAFLVLISGYVLFTFARLQAQVDTDIAQRLDAAGSRITKNIDSMRMHMYTVRNKLEAADAGNQYEAQLALGRLNTDKQQYYVMNRHGAVVGTGIQLDSAVRQVTVNGHAVAYVPGEGARQHKIAFVIDAAPHYPFYICALMTPEDFFTGLLEEIDTLIDCGILFDSSAAPIVVQGPAESGARETIESVQRGGALYLETGPAQLGHHENRIRMLEYNVYLPISQPVGWFVGLRLNFNNYTHSVYSLLVSVGFCTLCLLALLVCYLVIDARNRRRYLHASVRRHQDPLTGLYTTNAMELMAEEFFKKEPVQEYSLVALDLAAFHRFNTMFGYDRGDDLLRVLGKGIRHEYHCGTHVSSDIFAFFAQSRYPLYDSVCQTLNGWIERELGAQYLPMVNYKIGVYPLLQEKPDFRSAYDGALMALKTAKGLSKQDEVVYDDKMQQEVELNRNVENYMQQALDKSEFVLYVQPKFFVDSLACCGGEALVRWQSEQMGFLLPFQFIPLFEQNAFIAELDFYVLTKVLEYLQNLMDRQERLFGVAVNQSRVTINFPNYLERLKGIIANFTVPLSYVELEVTESALTDAGEEMTAMMLTLQDMGFSISMDDFGTGYSSLNALRELPVNILKIDKSFLDESDTSERGRKIISSVISMSKSLGIGTVCEGVESGTQLDFLIKAGCDIAQGYLLAKPMPIEEFYGRFFR